MGIECSSAKKGVVSELSGNLTSAATWVVVVHAAYMDRLFCALTKFRSECSSFEERKTKHVGKKEEKKVLLLIVLFPLLTQKFVNCCCIPGQGSN